MTIENKNATQALKLDLQYFADNPPEEPETPEEQTTPEGAVNPTPEKTFTQAELDEILAKRLKREKEKQTETEARLKRLEELEKAEEERKKAAMSEQERLKAEKEEAEKLAAESAEKAEKAQEVANQRIIDTEIRATARSLNANDINDVLALMGKEGVEIDDKGNVIGVEEAVAALKEAKPWMFKKPIGADATGGSNPAKNPTLDEISAKEKELADLKAKAAGDSRLLGKVTKLANEILGLKTKNN